MRTNRTNFTHAAWALLIQAVVTLLWALPAWFFGFSYLYGLWAGAQVASWGFVKREHAHEQHDIKVRTGVAIKDQNPLDGFRWRDDDRKNDAGFPAVASHATAGVVTAAVLLF